MRIRQKKVGVAYWAKVRKDLIFILSLARDEERYRQNVCDHVSTILQFCKQKSMFFSCSRQEPLFIPSKKMGDDQKVRPGGGKCCC